MKAGLTAIQEQAIRKTIEKLLTLPDNDECVIDRWQTWFRGKKLPKWPNLGLIQVNPFYRKDISSERMTTVCILVSALSGDERRFNALREIRDVQNEIEDRKPKELRTTEEENYLKQITQILNKQGLGQGIIWRQSMILTGSQIWAQATGRLPPRIRWLNPHGKDEYDREPKFTFSRLMFDVWSDVMRTDQRVARISFSDTKRIALK